MCVCLFEDHLEDVHLFYYLFALYEARFVRVKHIRYFDDAFLVFFFPVCSVVVLRFRRCRCRRSRRFTVTHCHHCYPRFHSLTHATSATCVFADRVIKRFINSHRIFRSMCHTRSRSVETCAFFFSISRIFFICVWQLQTFNLRIFHPIDMINSLLIVKQTCKFLCCPFFTQSLTTTGTF